MSKKKTKFKLLVYDLKEYTTKEELNKDIALIKNRILDYPKELSIKEVSECCIRYPLSFSYGVRSKSSTKAYRERNWRQQQLIAVDIDNDLDKKLYLSYEDAIKLCIKNNITPSIVYTTHSSTNNCNRYRMIFALIEPLTDKEEYKRVLNGLANILSVNNVTVIDTKCSDVSRVFYPGNAVVYLNENISIKKEDILVLDTNNYISKGNHKNGTSTHTIKSNITNIVNSTCSNNNNCINTLIESVLYIKQLYENNILNTVTLYNTSTISNNSNSILLIPILNYYRDMYAPLYYGAKSPIDTRVPDILFEFFRQLPLNLLIGKPFETNFSCILGTHEDKHPSARIEQDDTGRYIYHCYACDVRYDIIDLISTLAHVKRVDSVLFLKLIFNIKTETDWQRYQTERLKTDKDYMMDCCFIKTYPLLHKTLLKKNLYPVWNMLLDLARLYLYDKEITKFNSPIFYLTHKQLSEHSIYYSKKSSTIIGNNIRYLSKLGIIKILPNSIIPPRILKRLNKIKKDDNRFRRMNCYVIPDYTPDLFQKAEECIKQEKKNIVRSKNATSESVNFYDKQSANAMFSQDQNKNVSKNLLTKYKQFKQRAIRLLNKQGFFIESDLTSYMRTLNKQEKEYISYACLPKLMEELNIQRVAFSKKYEKMFNTSKNLRYKKILTYGCSRIFIKK